MWVNPETAVTVAHRSSICDPTDAMRSQMGSRMRLLYPRRSPPRRPHLQIDPEQRRHGTNDESKAD